MSLGLPVVLHSYVAYGKYVLYHLHYITYIIPQYSLIYSYVAYQGCGSATRFRDCRTKKKIIKKLALTWSRGGPSLPAVENPPKICVMSTTRNVGPRF